MPARPARPEEPEGEEIAPGDVLEHPTWGYCDVVAEREPGAFDIRIRDRGQVRTIKPDVFDVKPLPERDGVRVWALRPRGR